MDITFETFKKRQSGSVSKYVQWIPIARLVTLFRRRKKESIILETEMLIARR